MKKRLLTRILVLLLVAVFTVGCGAQGFDPTELNNKVAELEQAKNDLEAQIGSLIATNEELKAANQQLADSVRNLTNDAPSAKNIENLQNAQQALITQVAGLEKDLQNALNDIQSQKETIASQGRTIADQKKTIADQESLAEEQTAVLLALTEKAAELDSLKSQMSSMQEAIGSATSQLQELRTQYNDALSKYGALDSRTKALEDRVSALESQITGFQNQLAESASTIFDEKNPGKSPVDLSFSWVLSIPEVTVILSGMSGFDQLQQNLSFFDINHEITNEESSSLFTLAEQMKNAVPCTACRYCCEGCPMGLNIPLLFSMYNDARFTPKGALSVSMQLDALGEEGGPTACLGCGACAAACPQSIDIPSVMSAFSKLIPQMPNWGNICAKRAEAERKLREGK